MPGLFTPLNVRNLNIKNRIVLPPMARELSTEEGVPTMKMMEHYGKYAGKVGLVIVEHAYVDKKGRLSQNQLGIYRDSLVPELKNVCDAIKSKDTPAVIQINHAGGTADEDLIGGKPVAPSQKYFDDVDELNLEEIDEIKTKFVEAADRAQRAGFDGVEIHGAHGFLLNQFFSPLTNNRDDRYGGSIENRMRLPLEIIKEIKEKVDITLLYRLGANDRKEGGVVPEDSKKFARKIEKAGIDILDISGGLCGSTSSEFDGQGYFIPLAQKMKEVVDIPVIGVGGITDPGFADEVIREERVDLVAVGRAQLKDSEWAVKAKEKLM